MTDANGPTTATDRHDRHDRAAVGARAGSASSGGGGGTPTCPVLAQLAALQAMPTAELKCQWRSLFGTDPPPFNRPYLQSRLAYRIQELAQGGLKPATSARLAALGERLDGGNPARRRVRADGRPLGGTRLLREHQGVEHTVTVLGDGYEWQGRPYRSLSAIARAVTGTRWNGWTFFGLPSPGRA